ncbi:GH24 family phage-related lysozyme (muramidase) [Neorhizobium huautlense]|uniref:GH24 family phage-related lysozyme (Muramidase) n=1 Tax=Neorhizobium huautlense TaxID=67774 RepID=A0ABT9PWQ9_9HYPH|nr:hypothetical protein [Neorhizobium huautlense]MDP9838852.1 GH24 family phage-related lysozyme (muramidase) [Neorhizobium huautlense]
MTEEKPTTENPDAEAELLQAAWAIAAAQRQPLQLNAAQVDNLLSVMFQTHSAIFNVSTAISKMHVGDVVGSKTANSQAVEIAKSSLELLKNTHNDIRSTFLQELKDGAGK